MEINWMEQEIQLSTKLPLPNTGNTILDQIQVVDTITDADGNPTDLTNDLIYVSSSLNGGSQVIDDTADQGVLLVGEVETYTVDYIITQTASDSGLITNKATVTAFDPVGNSESISDEIELATGADLSLKVLKTWSNKDDFAGGIVDVGDTVVFTIEVTNTGNIGVVNINYTDILRDGNYDTIDTPILTFVGASENSPEQTLNVGEIATYTYEYVIDSDDFASGLISNQVTFSALAQGQGATDSWLSDDPTDPTSDNDPTVIPMGSDPSMAATKTVRVLENGDGFLGVGDSVEYTIIVENTGNTILDGVEVQDNAFIDDNNTSLTLTTGPSFTISSEGSDEFTLIPGEKAYYIATFDLTQSVVDAGGLEQSSDSICE